MPAIMTLNITPVDPAILMEDRPQARGLKHYLQAIWSTISKYVSFEEDAIFKDPDWPYMWEHKS